MLIRKRFDIEWLDLAAGMAGACLLGDESHARTRLERSFDPGGRAVACLSVRSAFDACLTALALPRGSHVLMSALTIPDMWRIVDAHGLVPRPVDVEPDSLAPSSAQWRRALTRQSRMAVLAHLFGSRTTLAPLTALRAQAPHLVLVEDAAQAYAGRGDVGSEAADVSLFSFGPIKTATALGGGLAVIRPDDLRRRVRSVTSAFPAQRRWRTLTRCARYGVLKLLASPGGYAALVATCRAAGRDYDAVVRGLVRGFPHRELLTHLRQQPSPALCRLLGRRVGQNVEARVRARAAFVRSVLDTAGVLSASPGGCAETNHFWVVTLTTSLPDALVDDLRAAGFDATRHATLSIVPSFGAAPHPRQAQWLLDRLVYVPVYPEMGRRRAARLSVLLSQHGGWVPIPSASAIQRPRWASG